MDDKKLLNSYKKHLVELEFIPLRSRYMLVVLLYYKFGKKKTTED